MATWAVGILTYVVRRRRGHRARLAGLLSGLFAAVILALLLTAPQVLPVLDQITTSVRMAADRPENLYDSSLLPYRVVEWIWPNVFGTFTAGNHYWIPILPPVGAHRPSPLSLYAGALPFVLALGAAGFRGGPPWRAWMTAIAVLSFWASLGEFAGLASWSAGEPSPNAGDDSLYGLLATILPVLRLFRFPFKLLVFSSLALSALAGLGWDRVADGVGHRRSLVIATGLLALSALALVGATWLRVRIVDAIAARESTHAVFGPLDAKAAFAEIIRGLAHGGIASGLTLVVLGWARSRVVLAGLAAVGLLAIDLSVTGSPLVITMPQSSFERESAVLKAIRESDRDDPSPGPFRIHRLQSWVPIGWAERPSTNRLGELVEWEIDTLQPGFGLLGGMSYVFTDESETGHPDYRRLFLPAFRAADPEMAAMLGVEPGRRVLYHPRGAFDLWGARFFVIPSYPGEWSRDNRSYAAFLDQTDLIYPDPKSLEGPEHLRDRQDWLISRDVQVRRNRAAFPRAWVVHDFRILGQLDAPQSALRDALLTRLRVSDNSTRSDPRIPAFLREIAYVETERPEMLAPYLAGDAGITEGSEAVSVRYETSTRAVIRARLQRPGIVVLADAYDTGWRLTIDGEPAPVLRRI